jgi:hypothetical protein
MQSRLTVILSDNERKALQTAAERELRPLRDQARYLLREALEKRGLLKAQRRCAKEAA